MATVTQVLTLLLALTFFVESGVEYFLGQPMDYAGLGKYKPLLIYVSAAAGIGLAFAYHVDLLYLAQYTIGVEAEPTTVGVILTGIAVGRGGNFLHDFYKYLTT